MANSTATRRSLLLLVMIALFVTACGGSGGGDTPTDVPKDALVISFTYGSEKQKWIEAVTAQFNASNPRTAGGKLIVVQPTAIGSGESMDDILEGRAQPVLWSPASRLWLPIINDEWAQRSGKEIISDAECKDLVLSPVVVMMWRPMAEALGYPNTPIGWSDLVALATNPDGWKAYGQPQWGRFRFGHTHPDFSNSGLQAITAFAFAATGKQRGLTVEDVQKPETLEFMRDIESAIAHYGRSTGFFGTAMGERGTAYLSAAVVYESVVIDNNTNPLTKARLEFPLVAIYPKEGTFQSDHPACVLDAPWMTDELKEAAGIYRTYLLSKPVQQQALQFGFRPSDTSINITEPLTLANGVDPLQPQNTLQVPSAAVIREIRTLWEAQKRQVNLTLLIDISGSMNNEDRIRGAREGASAFIDQLAESDNMTLIVFDDKQDVLFENVNVGERRADLKRAVESLIPRGGTALFDSIGFSIDRMKQDPNRINALVVLTDGQDTNSTTYKDASRLMERYGMQAESTTDVSIFTIGYGSDADEKSLKSIAERGRGAYRKGTTADIRNVYLEISTFF